MNDQELKERIFHLGAFARTMHNGKLAEMIRHCTAKQIYDFHNAYAAVYRIPYRSAYLSGDRDSVLELSAYLKELEQFEEYDRIRKKNLQDFIKDLDRIAQMLTEN